PEIGCSEHQTVQERLPQAQAAQMSVEIPDFALGPAHEILVHMENLFRVKFPADTFGDTRARLRFAGRADLILDLLIDELGNGQDGGVHGGPGLGGNAAGRMHSFFGGRGSEKGLAAPAAAHDGSGDIAYAGSRIGRCAEVNLIEQSAVEPVRFQAQSPFALRAYPADEARQFEYI